MNKYYQRSYRAERKAFKQLEGEGYTVIRASASKGVCDLIAFNQSVVRLIEIKVPDKMENIKRSKDEGRLRGLTVPRIVSREVWYWVLTKGWRKVIF